MGGWFGGVEQRVGGPNLAGVVDATVGVFEQVGGLSVDFKGAVLVSKSRSNIPASP
jgi:hypothetical protein